jgi:hypothetical protein
MADLSPGLLLALLLFVHPPRPLTVAQLRRQATAKGVRSINGRALKYAHRHQLVAALEGMRNG